MTATTPEATTVPVGAPVTDTTPDIDVKTVLTPRVPDVDPGAANMVAEGNPNAD
jgi:hypothetical protein